MRAGRRPRRQSSAGPVDVRSRPKAVVLRIEGWSEPRPSRSSRTPLMSSRRRRCARASSFTCAHVSHPTPSAGDVLRCSSQETPARAARRAVPGGGDFCGDEKHRPGVGARSALRKLTRRSCPNGESAANAVSSATRPRAEHRSGVGAQRRPPQHEPCRGHRLPRRAEAYDRAVTTSERLQWAESRPSARRSLDTAFENRCAPMRGSHASTGCADRTASS